MRERNIGGRGRKAEAKNQPFSVSLPPDLKGLLDLWAEGVNGGRSEIVAQLIEAEQKRRQKKKAAAKAPAPAPLEKERRKLPVGLKGGRLLEK